ncbi:Myb-like DNA-binding domain containing protein [Tritrichomonas foetus]|uniref:Myb-like DNA-binding domain containing protein n=1 Tax=Tritrichomonas foetus TaxID=1144522 RepID=A0A1J4JBK5_9EUKA|nr:Myb-like DNA-binding domain containing protein [Tritrichomonas foetus]|eukprot:OHS95623.1 Myb-like DNA-binding domain containing protein [Tritrichomonas foetus]
MFPVYQQLYPAFIIVQTKMTPSGRHMFTKDEDTLLKYLVAQHGTNKWSLIASIIGNLTARQCRERYKNYLSPTINSDPWSPEEDLILAQKYMLLGPKWSLISTFFKGRTHVSIKNRFNLLAAKGKITRRDSLKNDSKSNSPLTAQNHLDDSNIKNDYSSQKVSEDDFYDYDEDDDDDAQAADKPAVNVTSKVNLNNDSELEKRIWFDEFDTATLELSVNSLFSPHDFTF